MPTLLSIQASPRGDYSVSRHLSATFAAAWTEKHSGGTVVLRDLYQTHLPFVALPWIAGAYTPAEQHSPEMKDALAVSDELIAELQAADTILIGAPMYNFSVPAILKAWIDQVARIGKTFSASYEGLVKGKKVVIILSSGSVYTAGSPTEAYNVESSYLRQVLGFMGMTEVEIILAGGSGAVSTGARTLEDLLAEFTPAVVAAAAQ